MVYISIRPCVIEGTSRFDSQREEVISITMNLEYKLLIRPLLPLIDKKRSIRRSRRSRLQRIIEIALIFRQHTLRSSRQRHISRRTKLHYFPHDSRFKQHHIMMEIQFRIKIFHSYNGSSADSCFANYPFHRRLWYQKQSVEVKVGRI